MALSAQTFDPSRPRFTSSRARIQWRRALASAAQRALDVAAAALGLLCLAPLLACVAARRRAWQVTVEMQPMVGRRGRIFIAPKLAMSSSVPALVRPAAHAGMLWNLLRGELTLIGPRPVAVGELDARSFAARARQDVTPGLMCLWWVRRQTSIDYGTELDADLEYASTRTHAGDLGIGLRSAVATLYGGCDARFDPRPHVLGIPVDNLTMDESLARIASLLDAADTARVSFVNADCANIACRDAEYRRAITSADLVLADGIGMKLAGKLLGAPIRQNVNGTDMFPRLCKALAASGHRVFLLGGRPGVAADVAHWVSSHYPGVQIAGFHHGYFPPQDEEAVLAQVRASGAQLLLVAFGAPRQDVWIARHAQSTGARVSIGVGGLFDFFAGRVPRAPQWLREIGLEWAFRLYQEPGRLWRRYVVGNAVFLTRVVRAKFTGWHEDCEE